MAHMAMRVQKSLDLWVLDNTDVFLPIVWVVLDDGGGGGNDHGIILDIASLPMSSIIGQFLTIV